MTELTGADIETIGRIIAKHEDRRDRRVLAMIAVIEAAKAMREEYSAVARTHMPIFDTFDAALAALDKEQE